MAFEAADRADLIGIVGTASSDLRPAGVARFGSERVDVVSEGEFIPAGTLVRVIRSEGNRVTVRAETSASTDATSNSAADGREEAI